EWRLEPGAALSEALADYTAACEHSRAQIAGRSGEEEVRALREVRTVRWVVTHMIAETSRHLGHLDVLTELLDGRTGVCAPHEKPTPPHRTLRAGRAAVDPQRPDDALQRDLRRGRPALPPAYRPRDPAPPGLRAGPGSAVRGHGRRGGRSPAGTGSGRGAAGAGAGDPRRPRHRLGAALRPAAAQPGRPRPGRADD